MSTSPPSADNLMFRKSFFDKNDPTTQILSKFTLKTTHIASS